MAGYEIEAKHKERLSDESIDFILGQSESLLRSTVETSGYLLNRANSLLQIFIPIVVLTIGFIVSLLMADEIRVPFLILSIQFLILMVWCLVLAVGMYSLQNIRDVGAEPKKIICDELIVVDKQLREIKLNAIENYQDCINSNIESNSRRAKLFKKILRSLLVGAISFAISIPIFYCLYRY